jgi:hypothetical protein
MLTLLFDVERNTGGVIVQSRRVGRSIFHSDASEQKDAPIGPAKY